MCQGQVLSRGWASEHTLEVPLCLVADIFGEPAVLGPVFVHVNLCVHSILEI